jgi:hypothetical protein
MDQHICIFSPLKYFTVYKTSNLNGGGPIPSAGGLWNVIVALVPSAANNCRLLYRPIVMHLILNSILYANQCVLSGVRRGGGGVVFSFFYRIVVDEHEKLLAVYEYILLL